MSLISRVLLAAVVAGASLGIALVSSACSEGSAAADAGASDGAASAPDGSACAETLAAFCAAAADAGVSNPACCTADPGCVGHLPPSLNAFCASRLQGDAGVVQFASCFGFTIVEAPGSLDTSGLYFYDATGTLVAIGGWGNAEERCYAGPADFTYPVGSHRDVRVCSSIASPQCCPSAPVTASAGCTLGAGPVDAASE